MMRRTLLALSTAAALTFGGLATVAPAQAAERGPAPGTPTPLTAATLLSPLSLAAGRDGSLYVSENFAGILDRVDARGTVTPLATKTAPGTEVGAVSHRRGLTFYAESTGAGAGVPANNTGVIKTISASGQVRTVGDVASYEKRVNPDRNVTYGFRNLPAACLAQVPAEARGSYRGEADSHPYATLPTRTQVYVADAGGNDIVAVNRSTGRVRLVAKLPATPVTVTPALAASTGLPDCTVGYTYYLEPVPTDVVRGRDGWLYVSTLPGGPEDPSLGALGRIYRVDPWSGQVRLFASGLVSPTGLAVDDRGDVYVAELFGGRVSVIPRGSRTPRPFVSVPLPADVAIRGNTLAITTDALPGEGTPPAGQIVEVVLGRGGGCWYQQDD